MTSSRRPASSSPPLLGAPLSRSRRRHHRSSVHVGAPAASAPSSSVPRLTPSSPLRILTPRPGLAASPRRRILTGVAPGLHLRTRRRALLRACSPSRSVAPDWNVVSCRVHVFAAPRRPRRTPPCRRRAPCRRAPWQAPCRAPVVHPLAAHSRVRVMHRSCTCYPRRVVAAASPPRRRRVVVASSSRRRSPHRRRCAISPPPSPSPSPRRLHSLTPARQDHGVVASSSHRRLVVAVVVHPAPSSLPHSRSVVPSSRHIVASSSPHRIVPTASPSSSAGSPPPPPLRLADCRQRSPSSPQPSMKCSHDCA